MAFCELSISKLYLSKSKGNNFFKTLFKFWEIKSIAFVFVLAVNPFVIPVQVDKFEI